MAAVEALIAKLMAPAHMGRMVSPKYQGKHPMTPRASQKVALEGMKKGLLTLRTPPMLG